MLPLVLHSFFKTKTINECMPSLVLSSVYMWEWLYFCFYSGIMPCGFMFQQYKQAEEAFERVVQLDEDCEDAKQELETVKIQQLVEMGFVEDQAFAAIQQYGTVQVWALPCTLHENVFCLFSSSKHSGVYCLL
jgi:hypothetical protein